LANRSRSRPAGPAAPVIGFFTLIAPEGRLPVMLERIAAPQYGTGRAGADERI